MKIDPTGGKKEEVGANELFDSMPSNSQLLQTLVRLAIRDEVLSEQGEFDAELRLDRANACREYAGKLNDAGRFPEATLYFQEAADLYLKLDSPEAQTLSKECAKSVLSSLESLRSEPWNRLSLLIVKHERRQKQLALMPGTESEQAACASQIGRIFQRRDRPEEAVVRYEDAISLLKQSESSIDQRLSLADCHHRIATLYETQLHSDNLSAYHYEQALEIYETCEPALVESKIALETLTEALKRLKS